MLKLFMKKIKLIPLFILFLFANGLLAQLRRANAYYEQYDYARAIPLYKKAVKKSATAEALEKLANSYRLTKNYVEAEVVYADLMKQPNISPIDHFYYGLVLKNNNKIDEARAQFRMYADAAPADKTVEISLQSCDDIKVWTSKT